MVLRIATCQVPDLREDIAGALSTIQDYAAEVNEKSADLLCFPECFLQGYSSDPEYVRANALTLKSPDFMSILRRLRDISPTLVVGMIEEEDGMFFNTAVVIKQGSLLGRYRKAHLLPSEGKIFQPGSASPVFELEGMKLGLAICHDLNFPESVANPVGQGAHAVLCLCNNMLPRESAEKWKEQHHDVRCRRAKDAQTWLISSDVTGSRDDCISYGPTSVIDPEGIVIKQVPLMTTGIVMADISK